MNTFLKSLYVSALAIPFAASAQTPAATPAPTSNVAPAADAATNPTAKKIEMYGLVHVLTNLTDSERKNVPDFGYGFDTARLGLKVSEGIVKGQLEFQSNIFGLSQTGVGQPDMKKPKWPSQEARYKEYRVFGLRRADAGIDLPVGTSIRIGRVRPGAANGYGGDYNTVPDGFGFVDGAQIRHQFDLGGENKLAIGAVYGNGLSVPGGSGNGYFQEGGSKTNSKAYVVNADVVVNNIHAVVYYGSQKNQQQYGAVKAAGDIAEIKSDIFADATHTEASLGYETDAVSAGVWYQQIGVGEASTGKISKGKVIEDLEGTGSDPVTYTYLGVGVKGDGTYLDMKNLLQKDDTLIWGLGYNTLAKRDGSKDETDGDTAEISLSLGYKAGGFSTSLSLLSATSKGDAFTDQDGEPKNTALKTGVFTQYEF